MLLSVRRGLFRGEILYLPLFCIASSPRKSQVRQVGEDRSYLARKFIAFWKNNFQPVPTIESEAVRTLLLFNGEIQWHVYEMEKKIRSATRFTD